MFAVKLEVSRNDRRDRAKRASTKTTRSSTYLVNFPSKKV